MSQSIRTWIFNRAIESLFLGMLKVHLEHVTVTEVQTYIYSL